MVEHLSNQGRPNSRGRLHWFYCPNKTWTPPISTYNTLNIVKNIINLKKIEPPKLEGVNFFIKKALNVIKVDSQTPQKFLLRCFVAIKIEIWFVKIQMELL
jgi:hypothetical protein